MHTGNPEASENNELGAPYRFDFMAIFGKSRALRDRMALIQSKNTFNDYIHSIHRLTY